MLFSFEFIIADRTFEDEEENDDNKEIAIRMKRSVGEDGRIMLECQCQRACGLIGPLFDILFGCLGFKDLNLVIAEASNVEGSCNAEGIWLGLQNVVRVTRNTNATAPFLVCGAGSSDEAGEVYGKICAGVRNALTM
ncbi:hypothetical protein SASPL_136179 [Salvia splendens]|uniref:Uncharacterized protein n=1 Tax=Salvia splendens TaxID=180675 RepID=A0A8X8WZG5_SALSN|nr:hypothetical protein SASPL_136179 [Salvia splendens]